MTNVGALISTQSGLRTVVQVLPGHVDPALSSVITEPLGGNSLNPLTAEFFGTPLPGQAQSAASFVQTMIFPSDDTSSDAASASQAQTSSASTSSAPSAASTSQETSAPSAGQTNSTTTDASGTNAASANQTVSTTAQATQQSQAYTQAASAYQMAQQRGGEGSQRAQLVG
jgi:hypothetical protein